MNTTPRKASHAKQYILQVLLFITCRLSLLNGTDVRQPAHASDAPDFGEGDLVSRSCSFEPDHFLFVLSHQWIGAHEGSGKVSLLILSEDLLNLMTSCKAGLEHILILSYGVRWNSSIFHLSSNLHGRLSPSLSYFHWKLVAAEPRISINRG